MTLNEIKNRLNDKSDDIDICLLKGKIQGLEEEVKEAITILDKNGNSDNEKIKKELAQVSASLINSLQKLER